MSNFAPVPTYADPVYVDRKSGEHHFSPVWLKWFLDLSNGGAAGSYNHENLGGLQGGTTNQHYHLSLSDYANVFIRNFGLPFGITPGASPYVYHNTGAEMDVIVSGGTTVSLRFSRDNATWFAVGTLGPVHLSANDYLEITYFAAPTVTGVPR